MKHLHVAVAIIEDAAGRVLISRRPPHVHGGGLWEFPGGKLEPGESLERALRREIHEELGLRLERHRPLIRFTHHYPEHSVLLDVHRITAFSGEAHGREGQPLAWVCPQELRAYPLLPADAPIAMALCLPDRYLITGEDPTDRAGFMTRLEQALAVGQRLIQLRAKNLTEPSLQELARVALECCRAYGARLLLNAPPELAQAVDADGVHLSSRRLMQLRVRPLGPERLVAASCHDARELAQAERLGLDFAVLSPVLPTRSHPAAEPLGWARFAELVEAAALPVYALGGMHPGLIEIAQSHGAQGIAGISGLWPDEV